MKNELADGGYVDLKYAHGSDLSVVNSARASYNKRSETMEDRDRRLLKFLWNNKHYSPFRHASITFEVKAPLMVARQWWKYHVASNHSTSADGWNESSRRYISGDIEFYTPKASEWRSAPENSKQGSGPPVDDPLGLYAMVELTEFQDEGRRLFEKYVALGVAPEQARLFLPAYGLMVHWWWTTSLEGLIHFLEERVADDAQKEISHYARAVLELSRPEFPETFDMIGI